MTCSPPAPLSFAADDEASAGSESNASFVSVVVAAGTGIVGCWVDDCSRPFAAPADRSSLATPSATLLVDAISLGTSLVCTLLGRLVQMMNVTSHENLGDNLQVLWRVLGADSLCSCKGLCSHWLVGFLFVELRLGKLSG